MTQGILSVFFLYKAIHIYFNLKVSEAPPTHKNVRVVPSVPGRKGPLPFAAGPKD